MECLHAHIPSHPPTPSHMPMPSVTTVIGGTNDTHILSPYQLTSTQCKCQWETNLESIPTPITQLEVYVITMTVCLLWTTELFGSHRGSLTPMFQAFHLRGLTVPFLLRPTHIIYNYFYVLNRETSIGRRPKYELTTHSSTLMMNAHIHAHTPNMLMSLCICNANVTANSHVTCMMHTTWNILINRNSCQVPCNIYRKHISSIHFMPIFIDIVVICVPVGYAGINNIYKPKPPTAIALLLQYSGSRVEHRDGFSSHK